MPLLTSHRLSAFNLRPFALRRRSHSCNPSSNGYSLRTFASFQDSPHSNAASLVADTFIKDNIVIGIGTGAAITDLLAEIAKRLDDGRLKSIKCVPTSDISANESAFHGVPLTNLSDAGGKIDILIDVADVLSMPELSYIIGRGTNGPQTAQPSLKRIQQVIQSADTHIVLADNVCSQRLGGDLPVLITGGEFWMETAEILDDIFLGDAEIRRRSLQADAGPRGGDMPVLSEEGEFVLDIQFYDGLKLFGDDVEYSMIQDEIESVDGVLAHGLVVNKAHIAVITNRETGEVDIVTRSLPTTSASSS